MQQAGSLECIGTAVCCVETELLSTDVANRAGGLQAVEELRSQDRAQHAVRGLLAAAVCASMLIEKFAFFFCLFNTFLAA